MNLLRSSSPHQRQPRSTGHIMLLVLVAALPGLAGQLMYFGWGVLIQLIIAITACVFFEATVLKLRNKTVGFTLSDYSALLTGWLIAICLPPLLPFWMTLIACFFAIVVAKQLYGGLGYNIFNPAMVGYVVLLISFPAQMTQWLPSSDYAELSPSFLDSLWIIFTGFTVSGHDIEQLRFTVDGVSSATPLDAVKTSLSLGNTYAESIDNAIFEGGFFSSAGAGWGWVSILYLIGGIIMLGMRVISWHIPLSMLAGVTTTALFLNALNGDIYGSVTFHLFNGAVMLGAFFIATDPVSASTTPRGRIVFGAAIGFWVVIIRTFGGYPDAVAFAVLLLNMAVPLIDYYTQPRTYGYIKRRAGAISKKGQ